MEEEKGEDHKEKYSLNNRIKIIQESEDHSQHQSMKDPLCNDDILNIEEESKVEEPAGSRAKYDDMDTELLKKGEVVIEKEMCDKSIAMSPKICENAEI